ncbi:translation initiation factor IF-2 [Sandaracinomonas limnophila]|uniref:Translation initiation factor IF-2 n=1 Tax=Sandaracinomonas limnophila TaxID=1862386 RepID=A0A437PTF0_9BACT|nr:translation initiation factor IF-2 [Sandaracinomonas limnophila]RVU25500.1 translation initiation factor IF-2 [Sandaracinomonas limnophila]
MAEEKTMRLSLVAKQINVGTSTILQFLSAKGHKVDNNPNAKLNFEQLSLLANEYGAHQILDASEAPKKAPEVEVPEEKPVEKVVEPIIEKAPEPVVVEVPKTVVKEEVQVEKEPVAPIEEKEEAKDAPGLKILGKIELDSKGNPVRKKEEPKKAEPEKPLEKVVEEVKAVEPVKEEKVEVAAPAEPIKEEEVELIEAKGETLKGLTVLGKIELPTQAERGGDRKQKRKRIIKDEKPRPANQDPRPQGQGGGNDKFQKGGKDFKKGGQNQNSNQKVAPKEELSDKDIQEQIRATMARLQNTSAKQNFGADKRREKRQQRAEQEELRQMAQDEESKILKVTEFISASDLASLMNVSVNEVISTCMSLGMFVSINQRLDAEAITIIADEFGYEVSFVSAEEEIEASELEEEDNEADLLPRAPIVTIMGHVDHGKTSLLDYIRRSKVAAGEAGGITQHIGAYSVQTDSGKKVTFLDTPGHEAFTAMRARGAKVTDVVIIVIAADDSVMPQTKEAINHAMVANVPIIFAFSKIDKPGANADKVREELAGMNMLVEDWGGKYQSQEISSKSGLGVNDLLEKVLLEAEMLDLKANPNKRATGSVIEAELDKGRGYVTTLLVQAGTLKIGDMMLAGDNYGRVKAMFDHLGNKVTKAGPSTPVQVLGLNGAPQAGDKLICLENEREAKEIANKREQILREQSLRTRKHITLEEIGRRKAIGTFHELNVIIKGDVDGSVEALSDSLLKLSTDEVQVRILHKGVGQVSESDVSLAITSDAVIIAFQVRPSVNARRLAETEQIEIRTYSVIYQAIDDIKAAMEGLLAPSFEEAVTANIEVRDVFKISKVGTVAGCYVLDGTVKRAHKIRVIRDFVVVHEGEISALKRFKDDVQEVKFGYECGLSIKGFNDLQVGDTIECYEMKEVKRTLK